MLRKIVIYLILFILLTYLIISCPIITEWDRSLILLLQAKLKYLPLWLPMLPDCLLYTVMILIPLSGFGIFFIKKRMYKNFCVLYSIPIIAYLFNLILKSSVCRQRPPIELQITQIHPDSFSYVSSHSLVTFCLWGMVIFYLNKYCTSHILRISLISIAVLWIIFVGLSRVWIGVHNPTDILGAYILGVILVTICCL